MKTNVSLWIIISYYFEKI